MLPDVPLVLCHGCNHFFHEEDWELALMQKNECPFCRAPVDPNHGNGCALFVPEDAPAPAPPKRLERGDTARGTEETTVGGYGWASGGEEWARQGCQGRG